MRVAQQLQVRHVQEQRQEQLRVQQQAVRRELEIQLEARRLLTEQEISDLGEKLIAEGPEQLRRKIRQAPALERLVALRVVSKRRLPLERDLIRLLEDPDATIRQSAHEALLRICRGTDFGPGPESSARECKRCAERWLKWLALQQGPGSTTVAQADAPVQPAPAPDKPRRLQGGNLPLSPVVDAGTQPDARVAQLRDELVQAGPQKEQEVLARLRDSKGTEYSDALAAAIPRLAGQRQAQARQALAKRLTRMTARTLRGKLQEEDAEVRRAAAAACAAKAAVENIDDLIGLLRDSEPAVVQAARAALEQLTGKDFGPKPGASAQERHEALEAWRSWGKSRDRR